MPHCHVRVDRDTFLTRRSVRTFVHLSKVTKYNPNLLPSALALASTRIDLIRSSRREAHETSWVMFVCPCTPGSVDPVAIERLCELI